MAINVNEALTKIAQNEKTLKDFAGVMELALSEDRGIILNDVDCDSGDAVEVWVRFWNKVDNRDEIPFDMRKPIKIYINSYGGSSVSMYQISDIIKLSKTPVWTIATGAAYSSGFFVFINGHKRIAYPNASFLFHEGSVGQIGDAGKFRNFAEFYSEELTRLKIMVLESTKISEELYEKKKKDDWWFFPEEAIKLGVCDEIATEIV